MSDAVERRGRKSTQAAHRERHEDKRQVRPSDNEGPDTSATLQPLAEADPEQWLQPQNLEHLHVFLSVPNLGVDYIKLTLKDLEAHVQVDAQVLDLVKLKVGAMVKLSELDLEINNVRVQAMAQLDLSPIERVLSEVIGFLRENPQVLEHLTEGLGKGLEGGASSGELPEPGDETAEEKEAQ